MILNRTLIIILLMCSTAYAGIDFAMTTKSTKEEQTKYIHTENRLLKEIEAIRQKKHRTDEDIDKVIELFKELRELRGSSFYAGSVPVKEE